MKEHTLNASLPRRPPGGRLTWVGALVLAVVTGSVSAAPVLHENLAYGPADLQLMASRWSVPEGWPATTVSLAPTNRPTQPQPTRWTPFPHGAASDEGAATDPLAYALLGGVLLVVGLAARGLARRQRGLSKKMYALKSPISK